LIEVDDKMSEKDVSIRVLGFVALIVIYGSLSLFFADDRLRFVLYALPVILVSVTSAFPRWNRPRLNTVLSIGSLVAVAFFSVSSWSALAVVLTLVQIMAIALFGLLLVTLHTLENGVEGGASSPNRPIPADEARSILARELRRSRRTRSPLSLMILKGTDRLSAAERRDLVDLLKGQAREFDTVFSVAPDELGILCFDTTRADALQYAERLRATTPVDEFSIASFPDDAVTLNALFETARRGAPLPEMLRDAEVAAVAE